MKKKLSKDSLCEVMDELIEFFKELRCRIGELMPVLKSLDPSEVNVKQFEHFLQTQNILTTIEELNENLTVQMTNNSLRGRKNCNVLKVNNDTVEEAENTKSQESIESRKSPSKPRHKTPKLKDIPPIEIVPNDEQSIDGKNTQSDAKNRKSSKTFDCSFCNKKFKGRSMLTKHLKSHSDYREHLCITCGKSYKHVAQLNEHVRIHTGEKPYACKICGRAFTQAGGRNAHQRIHQLIKPFNCSLCEKSYESKANINTHMLLHSGKKPYKCSDCGKAFREQQHLKRHFRSHSGERPFSCDVCGKSFCDYSTIRKHKFSHQSTTPYQCKQCGKYLSSNPKLKSHMLTHTEELTTCLYCKRKFRNENTYKNHMLKCRTKKMEKETRGSPPHGGSKTNQSREKRKRKCKTERVEQSTGDDQSLMKREQENNTDDEHSLTRQGQKSEWRTIESHYLYKCLKCGYDFPAEDALNQHQLACVGHSTGPDATVPCSCSSCGSQFTVVSDLLNHLTECTSNRNGTSGSGVGYQGINPGSVHEQTSLDLSNVPYKCTYCGNLYITMQELSKHENNCHNLHDTNLCCANCLQHFTNMEQLSAHQTVCAELSIDKVNSFKCSECGILFDSQELFTTHQSDCGRITNVELSYCAE